MIESYFRAIETLIAGSGIVHSTAITYDKRSTHVGFIRGEVHFLDGSRLHVREFVNVEQDVDRYMYAYHYQRLDGTLVFRYDNTLHFPDLVNSPHHKHVGSETDVVSADPADLSQVLAEIRDLVVISKT